MKKRTFSILSADHKTPLYVCLWKPETEAPKGILQITHGMVEFIERYEDFANYLTQQGYLVVGHDHLGHGASVCSKEDWGYFAPKHSSDILVVDIHQVRTEIQAQYPSLPYFLLGHSMGSFLLRKYLCLHAKGLQGAIVMGTGAYPGPMVAAGKGLCHILAAFCGWRHRSSLIQKIVIGANDARFAKEHRKNSWISKDVAMVDAYNREPRCNFVFTLNGFYGLFDTLGFLNHKKQLQQMPKDLPVHLVSGAEDPVGGFGKGVEGVYHSYVKLGMTQVTIRLYPTDRHEILNETDRPQVYQDLYQWMEVHR